MLTKQQFAGPWAGLPGVTGGAKMKTIVKTTLVVLLLCGGVAAQAGDYYVTTNGTGKGTSSHFLIPCCNYACFCELPGK